MRRLAASALPLLLLALVPAATASAPLPVSASVEPTLPSGDCADCVGLSAGAAVFLPGCMDCPALGAAAGAGHGDGATTVEARVCYSSLWYFCFVDVEQTV